MKRFFTIIVLSFIILTAKAQQNIMLYNMPAVQQSMYINPAQMPQSRVNVGFPLMSSFYFNLSNSGFRATDLIKKGSNDSLHLDVDNMISKLGKDNYLSQSLQFDIISFGFRLKEKNYLSFSVIGKENISFRYPKNFIDFVWKGNGTFLGQDMNFNFGLNASLYLEYGIGFAREINDRLTLGGKLKYVAGKANIQTKTMDIFFNTDPTSFAYTGRANIAINTSGFDSVATDNFTPNNFLSGKGNSGAGIDLGGTFELNDKISLSASVIDLGFIKWKSNVTNFESAHPNQEFKYEGLNITPYISTKKVKLDSIFKGIADTLLKTFKVDTVHHAYTTYLPTQIYLGGNLKLTEKQNVGALVYGQFFNNQLHMGLSLSYNLKVASWFSVHTSYSYVNRDWRNIGIGFALTGPVQLYAVSDNVVGLFLPQSVKTVNVRMGINLCFGRKEKDRDKDGVPDKKDNCPDQPGPKELSGCPDRDGDGVIDKDDLCPDMTGLKQFSGCPDRDGDDIIDKNDSCPDIAGLKELNGCPDRDKDGVSDYLDECPDTPGLAKLHGCPDTDNDGVIDKDDLCPDVAGLVEMQGCPDRDGDGIIDKEDRCPDKAGPKENKGCPLAKLYILDKQGNVIATAVADKDGRFTFANLPADPAVLLKFESEDILTINEITVVSGTIVKVARKGADGFFHFENLKPDAGKIGKMEEPDVQIQLKKEEAAKVKKAMETLEFDSGLDIIRPSSFEGLNLVGELMQQNSTWRLKLSGHTDNVSSKQFNMKLSQKRVEAIKKYFANKYKIPANRFVLKWFGPTQPIASNATAEDRQKNRRVEFLFIK